MKIKRSAILYSGYDYQTLQGVKLLANWLHNPSKYIKVAFEADMNSNETPQGIDDIVCEGLNNIKDFWQVKFTPSPEKNENRLTWEWLLKISGTTNKSRSILKKLYDAISSVPEEKLGDVVLLTNKRPDRVMEFCLHDSRIDFPQIDAAIQNMIIEQLGNQKAATYLFSKLIIQHSMGDYFAIKRSVRSELQKFSDDAGVERLLEKAREWAIFQNNPPDDGWIYLNHVREILSLKRPEPISEIFSVPDDYCLPNLDFHNNLLNRINSSTGEVITITGKPGVGKSTYLSYLCQEMEKQEIPLVRHHYFLSLVDTTEDRLSPRIVAESLLHQINSFHKASNASTSKPEKLREALLTCAKYYKEVGKPFVVLVDGLDHVWRDNSKDKTPLEETFRQLLPATDNLVILIGTQSVHDESLPCRLLTDSPKKEWHWLPEMSGNSIYEFLKQRVESGRLFLDCSYEPPDEKIKESANALIDITNGYPLHVIYSSEYLSHNGLALSARQIKKLLPCSDGHIISYYSELWRNLDYRQKDVLHLCCGFEFAWPRYAICTIVKDTHECAPSVNAVGHMLSEEISGVRPFHESLVVFVRNQKEHEDRINSLLPCVCNWLSSKAPAHLKDSWLWSCQARDGNSSKLRQGVTRDWVLDRLIIGMPVISCIRLLSEAETYAFQELKYAEAYRHRALKTRLINGPKFQTWDLNNLEILSLIDADEAFLHEIISRQNEYSATKLSQLAIALWYRGEIYQAKLLSQKASDRYRAKDKLWSLETFQANTTEASILIKAEVLTGSLNYDVIFDSGNFSNLSDEHVACFRQACCAKKDLSLLLKARQFLPDNSFHVGQTELDAIRLSIIEESDISSRPEYSSFSSQQLSQFLDVFSKKKFAGIITHHFDGQLTTPYKIKVASSYHDWFFSSLCTRLNAKGDYSWLPLMTASEQEDISAHYDLLNKLVDRIANKICAETTLKFNVVCAMFPLEPILDEFPWKTKRSDIYLKRAWIEIAADCHLITTKSIISHDELQKTVDHGVFRVDWIRLWYNEMALKLLDDDAAELLIKLEENLMLNELGETINYSNTYLQLAEIAFHHNKPSLFENYLRKTWDFVLGYGHHKDLTIFDVLKAVEYLSESNPDFALKILERISPLVFNISKFTDGEAVAHSKRSVIALLARLNPQTAASIYEQEINDGEWYYAKETIFSLLDVCDISSPIIKHLYLTGLHSDCYQILSKNIEKENSHAIGIAYEVESMFGNKVQKLAEDTDSLGNGLDEKILLQPSDYPPEKFDELAIALRGKYSTRKFWVTWYRYWSDQGMEYELLKQLTPQISTFVNSFDEKRYLLDLLFFSDRKFNGKSHAFNFLVAAHNAMCCWSDRYEPEENSISRLKILAEQYPKKINEFIKLTSSEPNIWKDKFGSLIIPDSKLVFLLSLCEREDEAINFTLELVQSLEDSVRNLQLTKPSWDWRQDDSHDEALVKSLVTRLKLPIPSVKLWVIDRLSLLLIDQHPKVEKLLKEDLANRKQESECVEVLCVFFIAKSKGYVCPNDLGQYIKARSILSDLMLSELVPASKDLGKYAYLFYPFVDSDSRQNQFEYYQGNHVPRLYYSRLKKEERKTDLPFTDQYQAEWNNTFKYQPSMTTNIDYFFSWDRKRTTGQFYTQAGHRGRSAYLRTIQTAMDFYGITDYYAKQLSISALPIEPSYLNLTPKKPTWLPEWPNKNVLNENNLINFVEEALAKFKEIDDTLDLLATSLPIRLDDNKWVDLTIVKAVTKLKLTKDIQIEERMRCVSVDNLLDKELSYEFDENMNSECSLLAYTPFSSLRYGHWNSDLETRGFYIPRCNIYGKKIIGFSAEGLFNYSVGGTKIGYSSFWYNHWQPVHPKGIRSLCGSYTAIIKEKVEEWLILSNTQYRQYYVCKAIVLSAENDYSEFNEQEIRFVIH